MAAAVEMPVTEARTRQCRAARRYFANAFGFPVEAKESMLSWLQGCYYVAASTVHPHEGRGVGGGIVDASSAGPMEEPRRLFVKRTPNATSHYQMDNAITVKGTLASSNEGNPASFPDRPYQSTATLFAMDAE